MTPLKSLIGNEPVKNHLNTLLTSNTIPQSLLFAGPAGVGKATFAKAFAKTLLKSTKKDPPDLFILEPEGKNPLHSIESIRNAIKNLITSPFESTRKIIIIDDADKMLPPAANALLKTLEEPPSYGHFILTSSHPDRLLPTILSRCVSLPFKPLTHTEMLSHPEGKMPDLSPIFDYLENNTALDGDPEELLPLLFFWYRDRHLLSAGGDPKHLFFKNELSRLEAHASKPLPSLESLHKLYTEALDGATRHIKFQHFLTAYNQ